jgi:hypothetical protein
MVTNFNANGKPNLAIPFKLATELQLQYYKVYYQNVTRSAINRKAPVICPKFPKFMAVPNRHKRINKDLATEELDMSLYD